VTENKYIYRDPAGLSAWLVGLSWAVIAVCGTQFAVFTYELKFLRDIETGVLVQPDSMRIGAMIDGLTTAASGLQTIVVLVSLVVFLVWIYRVSANVHALGAKDLTASPGLAVGFYFIPFANLVMPPFVMGEIWRASAGPDQWRDEKGTGLIAVWWILQLVVNIGGLVTSLVKSGETIDAIRGTLEIAMAFEVLSIAFHFSIILLVRGVARRQRSLPHLAEAFA
jgi:hypothetical protein